MPTTPMPTTPRSPFGAGFGFSFRYENGQASPTFGSGGGFSFGTFGGFGGNFHGFPGGYFRDARRAPPSSPPPPRPPTEQGKKETEEDGDREQGTAGTRKGSSSSNRSNPMQTDTYREREQGNAAESRRRRDRDAARWEKELARVEAQSQEPIPRETAEARASRHRKCRDQVQEIVREMAEEARLAAALDAERRRTCLHAEFCAKVPDPKFQCGSCGIR